MNVILSIGFLFMSPVGVLDTPPAQAVRFETPDGVRIAADYFAPSVAKGQKAPAAILIHMYPAARSSWGPLVGPLHDAGFAVLAYDIRGRGDSTEPDEKKLREKYNNRDTEHFNSAWQDADAAKRWLGKQADVDTGRLVCIGASIGCSISLDYGSRDGDVKAIVCLSPGTNYFGVDSLSHIKKCGKRAILLIAPESEYASVEELIRNNGSAKGLKFPGGREMHGTNLLLGPSAESVKKSIVEFVKKAVGK